MQPPAGASQVVAYNALPSDTDWPVPSTRCAKDVALGVGVGLGDGDTDGVEGFDCEGEALAPYDTLGDAVGEDVGNGTQATSATQPGRPADVVPPRKITGPSAVTILWLTYDEPPPPPAGLYESPYAPPPPPYQPAPPPPPS